MATSIDRNAIGDRGEAIFFARITALHGGSPLFKPAFLGEKWAVADFAVELVCQPGQYFLVQVKSTTLGYLKNGNLRVGVNTVRYRQLAQAWIPAYVVGIDDRSEDAYICAVGNHAQGPRSLKVRYPLRDPTVRAQLHQEVRAFWGAASSGARPWTSRLY